MWNLIHLLKDMLAAQWNLALAVFIIVISKNTISLIELIQIIVPTNWKE